MSRVLSVVNFIAALAGSILSAGCSTSGPCGNSGQQCCYNWSHTSQNACNTSSLVCTNGTCQGCGGANQPCCPNFVCTGSLQCVNDNGPTCKKCGQSGQPCCDNAYSFPECAAGVSCDMTHTCGSGTGNKCAAACANSTSNQPFECRQINACSHGCFSFFVPAMDVGAECATCQCQAMFNDIGTTAVPASTQTCMLISVYGIDPSGDPKSNCHQYQVNTFNQGDATTCAQNLCGNSCMITLGTCPQPPP